MLKFKLTQMCAQPLSKDPLNFSKAKSYLDKVSGIKLIDTWRRHLFFIIGNDFV